MQTENKLGIKPKNLHGKIKEACENGDLEFIKEVLSLNLIKKITPKLVDNTIKRAASNGNVGILQCFLESPHLKSRLSKYIVEMFYTSCAEGQLNIVKYLVEQHPDFFNEKRDFSRLHTGACNASTGGNVHIIDYIFKLNHPNLLPQHVKDGTLFSNACVGGKLDTLRYLFSNPQLREHIDIHVENDRPFKHIVGSGKYEAIRYFIFDLNIKKTKEITKFLNKDRDYDPSDRLSNPYFKAQEWFKLRKITQRLEKELSSVNHNSSSPKKIKI